MGPFAHGVGETGAGRGPAGDPHPHLRDYTFDRHRTVDDRPFGGGEGMVLKPEPIFLAVESIWPQRAAGQKVILLSAQGRVFDQGAANRLSQEAELLLICGRYEEWTSASPSAWRMKELSIGNYVLSAANWPRRW